MKIIAIDPGYDRVGVAVIEKSENTQKESILHSTCITTDKSAGFYDRLGEIQNSITKIIKQYQPEIMVMEELYFAKNSPTALRVAEARGIISGQAVCNGVTVEEIHPNHVKIAITGYGNAKKDDILFMLPKLVNLEAKKRLDDELDAIAVGIAFFAHYKTRLLGK